MCTHHPLDSESFIDAIRHYIDQEKPDPLQKRQMEGWKWVWHDANLQDNTAGRSSSTGVRPRHLDFEPTNVLMGSLEWMGNIIVVSIKAHCYWSGTRRRISVLPVLGWSSFRRPLGYPKGSPYSKKDARAIKTG